MSNKPKSKVLKDLLEDINYKIEHIEDITADNRAIIVKLVKQNNEIVNFLKQLDVEDEVEIVNNNDFLPQSKEEKTNFSKIKDLVEEYMDKFEDLKVFEEELKKNKDSITPGQIGEA